MDDVTIEDEFELNEDKLSQSEREFSLRKSFSIFQIHDRFNRYDDMERIRQKQQKAYEEQALRCAQQKKKIESAKTSADENSSRTKYRSSDYNPLTGQSNRGSSDSCSGRPSSRRKPAGG
ncbi:unnamed protein product [Rotaria sp. Silwood1]|nr:unnamed protein product [Rotaria sp. Silwood1]CAF3481608.1 unnamed protein product [Rotaria sp. Silwood1]